MPLQRGLDVALARDLSSADQIDMPSTMGNRFRQWLHEQFREQERLLCKL